MRAALLMCSVDLPARCLIANMKQFNGKYGCLYCENPGTPRPLHPMVRDWIPGSYRLRTHRSVIANAKESIGSDEVVCVMHMYNLHIA